MQKIKRDDDVIVIAGKDKGKRGKVLKVGDDARLLVSGVNIIKRHTKPNPMAGAQGGIVEKEAPIHISNVAHVDPKEDKPTRVGLRMDDAGRKIRFAKRSGEAIDV